MSLLRIYGSLLEPPRRCQWVLIDDHSAPVAGEGELSGLPRGAGRVQLVIPAAQVLITRANVPRAARQRAESVLAYAVEEETVGDPDANQVSWLGSAGAAEVVAIVDRHGWLRWRDALVGAGISTFELHCETLLLPWTADEWSLAWDGREGYVRSGRFEGAATDGGDRLTPPLSLRMMLGAVGTGATRPTAIAIYVTAADAAPDTAAWQHSLGLPVRIVGQWDRRGAAADAGIALAREQPRWGILTGLAARLRPAASIVAGALAIHTVALLADWTRLAVEQRALQRQMESRFRAAVPDAVAVADPALQMRRKLAAARHVAGIPDSTDFLPMVERIEKIINELQVGSLRVASYEQGQVTLEMRAIDDAAIRRVMARLQQSGLLVDGVKPSPRPGSGTVLISVRSS